MPRGSGLDREYYFIKLTPSSFNVVSGASSSALSRALVGFAVMVVNQYFLGLSMGMYAFALLY